MRVGVICPSTHSECESGESLHGRATFAAVERGIKLNEFVKLAIEQPLAPSHLVLAAQ
jgi:hypothetical protein